jgi:hypothetical protein
MTSNIYYKSGFVFLTLVFARAAHSQPTPQFVWQGQVDGTVILHLAGKNLTVQTQNGGPVTNQKYRFSDPVPETQQDVRLEVLEGRGYVHVLDRPSIENHYTLAVEIEDRQPGQSPYSIALYWDTSDNAFERGAANNDHVTWNGRVDEAVTIACRRQACVSNVEQGAPVAAEHYKFSRPLPDRDTDVRLIEPHGRGEIRLIQQPRKQNNYTTRVSIHDPPPGAGDYSFTLAWNRVGPKDLKEAATIPDPIGKAFLWSGTVDGSVHVTLQGGASFSEVLEGGPIVGEHGELLRRLPARSDLMPMIQKLRGRGKVSIVETPSEKNNYRLVFEIVDAEPGSDTYQIELDW